MDSKLKNQVVMITGASGGIGSACARAFAADGARLILHANRNLDAAERLSTELSVDSIAVQADLTREDEVRRLFEQGLKKFGRLDVVVANAGIWTPDDTPIHKMPLDQWNQTIAVDQTSVFLCAREFFRFLEKAKPKWASLVIIGSTAAVFGEEGHVDYAAAKAAITYGLTLSLKNEIARLVPRGRVNAVCPGWVATPMAEAAMADTPSLVRALQTRPIKRIARAEDVARSVLFLASDRLAGLISGDVVTVAGGMEGRLLHQPESIDPSQV